MLVAPGRRRFQPYPAAQIGDQVRSVLGRSISLTLCHDLGNRLCSPVEGVGVFVVMGDVGKDLLAKCVRGLEVGESESLPLENAEPLLDLVHPRAMNGREVELEPGVLSEPSLDELPLVHADIRGRRGSW